MPRRVLGLYVTHRLPHEPEVIPWQEWLKLVQAAVEDDDDRIRKGLKAIPLSRPGADRCQFVSSKTGEGCKGWVLLGGATRCTVHGGPRQVPHHRLTLSMWRKGEIQQAQDAMRSGQYEPAVIPNRQAEDQVKAALAPFGIYHHGPHGRAGRKALRSGDAQAWQAWLIETQAIAAQQART